MRLAPDVDYCRTAAELSAEERTHPGALGNWLAWAWADDYRSQVEASLLLEFNDVATFLFDQASEAGASQADRTIASSKASSLRGIKSLRW